MPEEIGKAVCETRRNVRGNGGKHVGNCSLQGFLRHLVTNFQASSYIDGKPLEFWGISVIFPVHLSL